MIQNDLKFGDFFMFEMSPTMEIIASYRNVEINTKPNEKPAKLVNMPSDTMCISSDKNYLRFQHFAIQLLHLWSRKPAWS